MSKYFIDTEFLEGTQKVPSFFRKKETKPTIDLISIGIIAEDDRKYYAISKDFNLKEAWNRCQLNPKLTKEIKVELNEYWIRENVLKPIWEELVKKDVEWYKDMWRKIPSFTGYYNPKDHYFTYNALKKLINKYGKTNKQIAEEIKDFISLKSLYGTKDSLIIEGMTSEARMLYEGRIEILKRKNQLPKFYAYYADYDWVAFCWLFGKMIDLPDGFPMYCIDLKQTLDEKANKLPQTIKNKIEQIKKHPNFPKQTKAHNALDDAIFNKNLYQFLNTL